jgi:hypothetical protein
MQGAALWCAALAKNANYFCSGGKMILFMLTRGIKSSQ